jgi:hypothetical protein
LLVSSLILSTADVNLILIHYLIYIVYCVGAAVVFNNGQYNSLGRFVGRELNRHKDAFSLLEPLAGSLLVGVVPRNVKSTLDSQSLVVKSKAYVGVLRSRRDGLGQS